MAELILTLDTSTPAGSVALNRGETLLGEVLLHLKGTHTDHLLGSVQWLLAEAGLTVDQLDAFGAVIGPGSFTGLRVGVATVKGLAYAAGKPVVAVSSLATLAVQVPGARCPVCALIDARKKEVYAGLFACREVGPELLSRERVLSPEKLLTGLSGEVLFVGSGAVLYQSLIRHRLGNQALFAPWPLHVPRASSAAMLALAGLRAGRGVSPQELMPCYIRPSEAELMRSRTGDGAVR
jgi:tRNA threonylcarbamoyladenosine biosynthesis protein TsaB